MRDTRPNNVQAQLTPIYEILVSSCLEGKVHARTPSNIAVVNSGNAAPKAQRNTVLTAKADAVYILAKR